MGFTFKSALAILSLVIFQFVTTTKSDSSPVSAPTIWKVTESNVTCILLRATISMRLHYTDVYNKNQTHVVNFDIPSSANSTGSCSEEQGHRQHIMLTWDFETNSTKLKGSNNTLTLEFLTNTTSDKNQTTAGAQVPVGKYAIVKFTAVVQKISELFPNASNPDAPFVVSKEANNTHLGYEASLNHSYVCGSPFSINSELGIIPQVTISFNESQVEAFRKRQDETFGDAEHCPADEISSGSIVGTVILTISIIVLLALGVAALATYLLKKRRAAGATGYENM